MAFELKKKLQAATQRLEDANNDTASVSLLLYGEDKSDDVEINLLPFL